MKTPRWSILWIALLLGIATGDAVLQQPQEEGNVRSQQHVQQEQ